MKKFRKIQRVFYYSFQNIYLLLSKVKPGAYIQKFHHAIIGNNVRISLGITNKSSNNYLACKQA